MAPSSAGLEFCRQPLNRSRKGHNTTVRDSLRSGATSVPAPSGSSRQTLVCVFLACQQHRTRCTEMWSRMSGQAQILLFIGMSAYVGTSRKSVYSTVYSSAAARHHFK